MVTWLDMNAESSVHKSYVVLLSSWKNTQCQDHNILLIVGSRICKWSVLVKHDWTGISIIFIASLSVFHETFIQWLVVRYGMDLDFTTAIR